MIFLLILTLLLGILVLLLIPFGIYGLSRWLKRKGYSLLAWVIPALIITFFGYYFYISIYPPDQYYKEDFEWNTSLPFPGSASIIKKDATFPDQHGHYNSMAIFRVSGKDYDNVYTILRKRKDFEDDTTTFPFGFHIENLIREEIENYREQIAVLLVKRTTKVTFTLGFLKDHKTILFERCSGSNLPIN